MTAARTGARGFLPLRERHRDADEVAALRGDRDVLAAAAGRDREPGREALARDPGLDLLAAPVAKALAAAPGPLSRRAIRRWLDGGHPPDAATVERVLAVARGEAKATDVGAGRRVVRSSGRLRLQPPTF